MTQGKKVWPGNRAVALNLERRFLSRWEADDSGCWIWQGALQKDGYGSIGVGRNPRGSWLAHRLAYRLYTGPLTDGTEIDHTCAVRACVNPAHLEQVTHAENNRRVGERRTSCRKGLHPWIPENIYESPGHRTCALCRAAAPSMVRPLADNVLRLTPEGIVCADDGR